MPEKIDNKIEKLSFSLGKDDVHLTSSDELGQNTSTNSFHESSAFILCVTRAWTRIAIEKCNSVKSPLLYKEINIWTRKFCTLGGPQASMHWDSFMHCLAQNAHRQIILGCVCCGRVSEDERILLSILCKIQSLDITQAREALTVLMGEDSVPTALHHLIMFSAIMGRQKAKVNPAVITALEDKNYTSKRKLH